MKEWQKWAFLILAAAFAIVIAVIAIGSTVTPTPTQTAQAPAAPSSAQSEYPGLGEQGVAEASIGCVDFKDWEKLAGLAREHDRAAWDSLLASKFQNGACSHIDKGTIVTVKDTGILSSTLCVRPQGQPGCLWTSDHLVKRLPQ